ncbi:MAG: hypothetical protein R3Y43_08345 [Alphaproteobacteria bacterium]
MVYFLLFCFFPCLAHAYIDPGTGSLFLQAIIAFFVTFFAFAGSARAKVVSFFNLLKRKKNDKEK